LHRNSFLEAYHPTGISKIGNFHFNVTKLSNRISLLGLKERLSVIFS